MSSARTFCNQKRIPDFCGLKIPCIGLSDHKNQPGEASQLNFRVTVEILDLRGFENLGGFGEASEISDPKIKL
jgi:hypothetical protein